MEMPFLRVYGKNSNQFLPADRNVHGEKLGKLYFFLPAGQAGSYGEGDRQIRFSEKLQRICVY